MTHEVCTKYELIRSNWLKNIVSRVPTYNLVEREIELYVVVLFWPDLHQLGALCPCPLFLGHTVCYVIRLISEMNEFWKMVFFSNQVLLLFFSENMRLCHYTPLIVHCVVFSTRVNTVDHYMLPKPLLILVCTYIRQSYNIVFYNRRTISIVVIV